MLANKNFPILPLFSSFDLDRPQAFINAHVGRAELLPSFSMVYVFSLFFFTYSSYQSSRPSKKKRKPPDLASHMRTKAANTIKPISNISQLTRRVDLQNKGFDCPLYISQV
jgi:hypothetical protein